MNQAIGMCALCMSLRVCVVCVLGIEEWDIKEEQEKKYELAVIKGRY